MSKMIYINLPVTDISAATRFYEALGCTKNDQFSDHQSSSMVWSEAITFQLLAGDYFSTFTPKKIADAHATSEVLLALSLAGREEVDTVVQAAAAAGGKADVRAPQDMGWLYNRSFEDPDGHMFEAISADMASMPTETEE